MWNWSPALEDLDNDLVAGFHLPRSPPLVELIVTLPWCLEASEPFKVFGTGNWSSGGVVRGD
jgi:hypothetical protein